MKKSFKDVINFLEEKGCNLDIMDRLIFEVILEDYDCMSNSDAELLGDLCNQDKYSVVDRENEEIIYDCMKDNGVVVINIGYLDDILDGIKMSKANRKLIDDYINDENNICLFKELVDDVSVGF